MKNNIDITIEKLNDKLKKFPASYSDKYIEAYPHLIENVAKNKTKDIGSLISIAHMVYGWMPTIIETDFKPEDIELWGKVLNGSLD